MKQHPWKDEAGDVHSGVGYRNEIGRHCDDCNRKILHWLVGSSYLTLDVYFAKCCSAESLEKRGGFTNLHAIGRVVDYVLCTVGDQEFTADLIIVEAKLISEETQGDVSITRLR